MRIKEDVMEWVPALLGNPLAAVYGTGIDF